MQARYLVLPLLLLLQYQRAEAKVTSLYDPYITEACKLYLEELIPDCRWFKALLYTESRLEPDAESSAGARGIAQVMPKTWDEHAPHLGEEEPYQARASIRVGAYYLSKMIMFWGERGRTKEERMFLGMASYNAGPGNILKSQKKCKGARLWDEIKECLPLVTGKHSIETIRYVEKIKRVYGEIEISDNYVVDGILFFYGRLLRLAGL